MRNLKRKAAVVIAAMMILTAITGCGKQPAKEKETNVTSEVTQQSTQNEVKSQALKPVTLRLYFPGDKRAAVDEVWKQVGELTKDKLNATFEANWVPFNDYASKIQLLSASGDNYDLCFNANWLNYTQLANMNALMDVSGMLEKHAPNYYKKLVDNKLIKGLSNGGKIYALPWTLINNGHPWIGWANNEAKKGNLILENNSFHTIEELEAVLEKAHKALPKKHLLEWDSVSNYGFILELLCLKYNYAYVMDSMYGFTYSLDDPDCKLIPVEQTEMFKEAVALTRKWVKAGYIPSDLMLNRDAHINEPAEMKLLLKLTCEYLYYNDSYKNENSGYTEMYPDGKYLNLSALSNVNCINANAANPERTLAFIDLMASDHSVFDTVMYGIEGKTYVKKGNIYDYPEGMNLEKSNYMEWMGQWGFWYDGMMRPSTSRNETFWEKTTEYYKRPNMVADPLTGFLANTENIKNEIAKREANYSEFGKPIVYGISKDKDPLKDVETLINRQKDAGVEKIREEIQKQVDALLQSRK